MSSQLSAARFLLHGCSACSVARTSAAQWKATIQVSGCDLNQSRLAGHPGLDEIAQADVKKYHSFIAFSRNSFYFGLRRQRTASLTFLLGQAALRRHLSVAAIVPSASSPGMSLHAGPKVHVELPFASWMYGLCLVICNGPHSHANVQSSSKAVDLAGETLMRFYEAPGLAEAKGLTLSERPAVPSKASIQETLVSMWLDLHSARQHGCTVSSDRAARVLKVQYPYLNKSATGPLPFCQSDQILIILVGEKICFFWHHLNSSATEGLHGYPTDLEALILLLLGWRGLQGMLYARQI